MNSKLIVITIRFQNPSDMHLDEKSFGSDLQKSVAELGGRCVAKFSKETLTVFIQGLDVTAIRPLLQAYEECAMKHNRRLTVLLSEQEAPQGFALPDEYSGPGAIRREKLTKKLLFGLPAGVFVVSNLYPKGRSAFAEKMGAPDSRLDAWKRAVASGAAQCLCQVMEDPDDFIKAAFPRPGLRL
ncbi:MAG TPA: hypothetical protein VFE51_10975 [Verrucomicrobiae bacterium]|nr:hypothetical protein [Verrucomicrobiae bacterium]